MAKAPVKETKKVKKVKKADKDFEGKKPMTVTKPKKTPKAKKGTHKKGKGGWDMTALREAKYNPRFITDSRLNDLGESYNTFGDLSGVVFNAHHKSRVLISGHQRLKVISSWDTVVHTTKKTDKQGTIEEGHIEATSPDGNKTVRIPLRIVSWEDKKAEMAANIAANAHGGDFDNKKLATLVAKLDTDTASFPISVTGLDPLEIRGLSKLLSDTTIKSVEAGDIKGGRVSGVNNGSTGKFAEYSESDFDEELNCVCPRCTFRFSFPTKK